MTYVIQYVWRYWNDSYCISFLDRAEHTHIDIVAKVPYFHKTGRQGV